MTEYTVNIHPSKLPNCVDVALYDEVNDVELPCAHVSIKHIGLYLKHIGFLDSAE